MTNNLIAIAKITKPHGVMGDAKLMSYSANPEDVFSYPHLYDKALNKYVLKKRSAHENFFIVKLNQNNSRNLIEELAGSILYITREMLSGAEEGEYYHADLVGVQIRTKDDQAYGEVLEVRNFGAGDILEVFCPDKKDTIFLPFLEEFIIEIDMEKRYLVFDFIAAGIDL